MYLSEDLGVVIVRHRLNDRSCTLGGVAGLGSRHQEEKYCAVSSLLTWKIPEPTKTRRWPSQ